MGGPTVQALYDLRGAVAVGVSGGGTLRAVNGGACAGRGGMVKLIAFQALDNGSVALLFKLVGGDNHAVSPNAILEERISVSGVQENDFESWSLGGEEGDAFNFYIVPGCDFFFEIVDVLNDQSGGAEGQHRAGASSLGRLDQAEPESLELVGARPGGVHLKISLRGQGHHDILSREEAPHVGSLGGNKQRRAQVRREGRGMGVSECERHGGRMKRGEG